ncbi:MAG: hypothetical protein ACR2QZ_15585 [Woeseiaceae bacterium]
MDSISAKLNSLLSAFETHGAEAIRDSLLPGLSREEIQQRSSWFPASVPDPIVDMYMWRNGQANDAWNEPNPFWFRDMSFSSLEIAEAEYQSMVSSYGVDNTLEDDGVVLKTSFPFAAFNGGWYVVPAEEHNMDVENRYPVICVLQGIDWYFVSIEKMLDTCNEWVRCNGYDYQDASLDEESEMRIWKQHNPGVFSS